MTTKTPDIKIPLIYAYLYMRIKKQMRGNRIAGSDIRKIIQKVVLCDKVKGTKGIPRRYCYDIIKDLTNLNLIERVGKVGNNPIYEDNNEIIDEVIDRLKEWEINEKLRKDKNVKGNLEQLLKLFDEDRLYRVVKSQCDKELKQIFW